MVRRFLIQSDGQKLPQRERIGQTPRDATLAVEPFEETDHHEAEVQARRQGRPPQLGVIEAGATLLAEAVKTSLVENLVQAAIERMARSHRQLAVIPQPFLPLPLLPSAHCHKLILKPKHFQHQMFFDFRHGLLGSITPNWLSPETPNIYRHVRHGMSIRLKSWD